MATQMKTLVRIDEILDIRKKVICSLYTSLITAAHLNLVLRIGMLKNRPHSWRLANRSATTSRTAQYFCQNVPHLKLQSYNGFRARYNVLLFS